MRRLAAAGSGVPALPGKAASGIGHGGERLVGVFVAEVACGQFEDERVGSGASRRADGLVVAGRRADGTSVVITGVGAGEELLEIGQAVVVGVEGGVVGEHV